MSDLEIYLKISTLPDHLKKEVSDFVDFLKSKLKNDPSQPSPKIRQAGLAKGLIEMSDDFDEPLEDFQEYMP